MIILASTSPRRIELIKQLTDCAIIVQPEAVELSFAQTPFSLAVENARIKALSVQFSKGQIVLGADTVVALSGQVLGKPDGAEHARQMLKGLSGNTHTVITGVCAVSQMGVFSGYEQSQVTFNNLNEDDICKYIDSGLYIGKAGGYGLQDGFGLVKGVDGARDNVIGLPLRLCKELITAAGGGKYLKGL